MENAMDLIQQLAAERAIARAIYRYCRGVDRDDAAMIASVYHDDADENHGPFRGTGREFAVMLVPLMDTAPGVGGHHVTNILIDLHADGRAANAESYFIAFHPLDDGQRAFVTGRYIDRFEQRGGAWKIAQRHVIIDSDTPPSGAMVLDGYPRGGRRDADFSHGWIA
jgi:ketosteroid isomerase-like protein